MIFSGWKMDSKGPEFGSLEHVSLVFHKVLETLLTVFSRKILCLRLGYSIQTIST
jgi:hypothetical protein